MIWETGDNSRSCRLTSVMVGCVAPYEYRPDWSAEILKDGLSDAIEYLGDFPSESAAKAAVAAWIGKTIAQLGKALERGEPRIDEE